VCTSCRVIRVSCHVASGSHHGPFGIIQIFPAVAQRASAGSIASCA